MAGAKLSEFQSASALTGDELVGIVQEGENAQTTTADVAALAVGGAANAEFVRDTMGTALTAGAGITITVDDPGNTIEIANANTQYTDEMARDAVGAMFSDSATIDVTVDDGANTITLAVIPAAVKVTESFIIACSDENTPLSAGTAKITLRMPYPFTVTDVRGSLTIAQTGSGGGGIFTVDVNEDGVSILSTKLTFDNGEKTTTTAAIPMVISDASIADDGEITIDIDQIGDGTAKGLKVTLIGHRT